MSNVNSQPQIVDVFSVEEVRNLILERNFLTLGFSAGDENTYPRTTIQPVNCNPRETDYVMNYCDWQFYQFVEILSTIYV